MGYDADIPIELTEELPLQLNRCKTLSDLYRSIEGREFWKKHGFGIDLEFNLSSNSESFSILEKYLKSKGII